MKSLEPDVRETITNLGESGISLSSFFFEHTDEYYNQIHKRHIIDIEEESQYFPVGEATINLVTDAEFRSDGSSYRINFVNYIQEGTLTSASAGIQLVIKNWSEDAYLLLPGSAYNGNRFESRRIPYSPKLLDEKDLGPEKPIIISDVPRLKKEPGFSEIVDRSGSLSHPVILIWLPGQKQLLAVNFNPSNELGDLGLIFTENTSRNRLTISFQSPAVREKFIYTICDNQTPSPDTPYDFSEGDRFSIQLIIQVFQSETIEEAIRLYPQIRGIAKGEKSLNSTGLLSGFKLIESKFNSLNWVEKWGYYSVGMRENFLQDWQVGWTGGMISTYPLYLLGTEKTRKRVMRNFEWFFKDGFAPAGLPWDSGEKGNQWYGGDIRREITTNRHLVRKSGDALYYLTKQFFMLDYHGIEFPGDWVEKIKGIARIFGQVWNKYSQTGHFLDTRTNEIIIGGSTSGAILCAGLVLLSRFTSDSAYLELAKRIGEHYYKDYLKDGISCGGVGDALQNIDSESSYALCESFILLYESTRDMKWLERATLAADFFSTWVMSYNYDFPANSTHGKLGMKTLGTVFANSQNKHGCPGICTYSGAALLNIYRYTGNEFYIHLLEDIVNAMPQYLSTNERPINGLKEGWISERINTNDWLEGIGETMNGSTWAETSLMLSAAELPAIYVDTGKKMCWCFDQLKCSLVDDFLEVEAGNNIKFPVEISVLFESAGKNNKNYSNYGCLKTRTVELNKKKTRIKIA